MHLKSHPSLINCMAAHSFVQLLQILTNNLIYSSQVMNDDLLYARSPPPRNGNTVFWRKLSQKNFFQTWGGRSHNYCGVLRFSIVRNVKNSTTVANLFDSSFNVFSKCIVIVIVFVLAFEGVL